MAGTDRLNRTRPVADRAARPTRVPLRWRSPVAPTAPHSCGCWPSAGSTSWPSMSSTDCPPRASCRRPPVRSPPNAGPGSRWSFVEPEGSSEASLRTVRLAALAEKAGIDRCCWRTPRTTRPRRCSCESCAGQGLTASPESLLVGSVRPSDALDHARGSTRAGHTRRSPLPRRPGQRGPRHPAQPCSAGREVRGRCRADFRGVAARPPRPPRSHGGGGVGGPRRPRSTIPRGAVGGVGAPGGAHCWRQATRSRHGRFVRRCASPRSVRIHRTGQRCCGCSTSSTDEWRAPRCRAESGRRSSVPTSRHRSRGTAVTAADPTG
jgi:hypothetical protein